MGQIQKDYSKIMWVMLFCALFTVFPLDVWAASGNPFGDLCAKVDDAWKSGRQIAYIISGIGALALGVGAFFGRFRWGTFFALIGGIFIIAIFETILTWASTTGGGGGSASLNCNA